MMMIMIIMVNIEYISLDINRYLYIIYKYNTESSTAVNQNIPYTASSTFNLPCEVLFTFRSLYLKCAIGPECIVIIIINNDYVYILR